MATSPILCVLVLKAPAVEMAVLRASVSADLVKVKVKLLTLLTAQHAPLYAPSHPQ